MKGRIAFLLPCVCLGGAERVIVSLSDGLTRRGFDVDLLLGSVAGEYLPLVSPKVRIVDLGAKRTLRMILPVARYLRRERPMALLSTLTHVNIAAVCARRLARVPTRLVIREANTISLEARGAKTVRARRLPRLARWLYPLADAIIAVSEGAAVDLVESAGLPRERIRVLDNPIVTPDLAALAQRPVSHPWFSTDNGRPVIVAAGRLTEQKDFPTLLRAFAILRARRPARLLILGEGELRPRLEQLVSELGVADDVQLPGYVDNPFAFMSRAALFVLSSAWEGSPGVLIQALASGAPVVATDCESGPREILSGGRHGPLVPVGDVTRLAAAMEDVLSRPRQSPPPESWQRFSQDASLDAYLEVLQPC